MGAKVDGLELSLTVLDQCSFKVGVKGVQRAIEGPGPISSSSNDSGSMIAVTHAQLIPAIHGDEAAGKGESGCCWNMQAEVDGSR